MNFRKIFSLIGTTAFLLSASSFSIKNDPKINESLITQKIQNQIHRNNSFIKMNGTEGNICSLTINKNGHVFAGSSNGIIYRSKDGATFVKAYSDSIKGTIKAMVTADDGTIFAAKVIDKTKTIIYQKNKNIKKGSFFELASVNSKVWSMITDKFSNLYLGTSQGVFYCDAGETSFNKIEGTKGRILSLTTTTNGLIFAGSRNGTIYKSIGGYPFTENTKISDQNLGVSSLTTDKNNSVYATCLSGQVWAKLDSGSSFYPFKNQLNVALKSITVTENNFTYIGDSNGKVWRVDNALRLNWTVVEGTEGTKISVLSHSTSNKIYAGSTDGVYRLD